MTNMGCDRGRCDSHGDGWEDTVVLMMSDHKVQLRNSPVSHMQKDPEAVEAIFPANTELYKFSLQNMSIKKLKNLITWWWYDELNACMFILVVNFYCSWTSYNFNSKAI